KAKGKGIDDLFHNGHRPEILAGEAADNLICTVKSYIREERGKRKPATSPAARAGIGEEKVHYTDVGNAQRLNEWHGKNLLYVGTWEKWLTWQESHWQLDEKRELSRVSQLVA